MSITLSLRPVFTLKCEWENPIVPFSVLRAEDVRVYVSGVGHYNVLIIQSTINILLYIHFVIKIFILLLVAFYLDLNQFRFRYFNLL